MERFPLFTIIMLSYLAFNQTVAANTQPIWKNWQSSHTHLPSQFDWLLTQSNEWIKGEVITIYGDEVEFDSDEFGIIHIDWQDVQQLSTADYKSIRTVDGRIIEGKIIVKNDEIHFYHDEHINTIKKNNLLSMANSRKSKNSLWSGDVSAGATFRGGNTKQTDYTLTANAKRLSATTRFLASYVASYSETDNEDTENSHRLNASFDWFLSNKLFLRLPEFEYFRDPFQNIAHRASLSVGLGYQLIDDSTTNWYVNAGPGYTYTEFSQVEASQEEDASSPVLLLGTSLDQDITQDIECFFRYQVQIVDKEAGELIHHAETGFELDLGASFELDLTLYYDRIEEPIEDEEGKKPDTDDYRFVVSLSYDY